MILMPEIKVSFFKLRGFETSVLKSKLAKSVQVSFSHLSTNFKISKQTDTLGLVTFQEWETELTSKYEIRFKIMKKN